MFQRDGGAGQTCKKGLGLTTLTFATEPNIPSMISVHDCIWNMHAVLAV